jgi:hypothetical protein
VARFRLLAVLAGLGGAALACGIGLASASVAALRTAQATSPAQTSFSSNWAGYVADGTDPVSGAPTRFSTVSGTWVAPKADCSGVATSGPTASAFWVGLGGNSNKSNALEQAGTEADCTGAGAPRYFAWYELVPADSVRVSLNVTPGDTIAVTVAVSGKSVSIGLRNLSQGTSFSKTLSMAAPDTTSAEWIAEAPSLCANARFCRQPPLTNFGKVAFSNATTASGAQTGSISDTAWSAAPVALQAGGFYGPGHFSHRHTVSEALPSGLSQAGGAFTVNWRRVAAPQPPSGSGSGGGGGFD